MDPFAPKFKRAKVDDFSLDDFMTGGDFPVSDSQPSPLEQRCKVWKVDQVERVEKENGEESGGR